LKLKNVVNDFKTSYPNVIKLLSSLSGAIPITQFYLF
jgi:hypothetical protein